MKNLRYILDPSFRHAIEIRHTSWFNELFYNYLKEKNYCLVRSQQDTLITPPNLTSDFVYLRLIGDRSIDERDFGKINKDRTKEMKRWVIILRNLQRNVKDVKTAIVSANNHYAGFDPMTTKLFAEMIGLTRTISFPIQDHKSFIKMINLDRYQNENSFKINKRSLKKTKQTELSEFFE